MSHVWINRVGVGHVRGWRESDFPSGSVKAARLSSWAFVGSSFCLRWIQHLRAPSAGPRTGSKPQPHLTQTSPRVLQRLWLSETCSSVPVLGGGSPLNGAFVWGSRRVPGLAGGLRGAGAGAGAAAASVVWSVFSPVSLTRGAGRWCNDDGAETASGRALLLQNHHQRPQRRVITHYVWVF